MSELGRRRRIPSVLGRPSVGTSVVPAGTALCGGATNGFCSDCRWVGTPKLRTTTHSEECRQAPGVRTHAKETQMQKSQQRVH
jgi:hypothetical protein